MAMWNVQEVSCAAQINACAAVQHGSIIVLFLYRDACYHRGTIVALFGLFLSE